MGEEINKNNLEEALSLIEKPILNNVDISKIKFALKQGICAYENWLECEEEIKKALTPPTEEEVCEALTDWGIKMGDWERVWYKDGIFYADEWTLCYINKDGALEINCEDLLPKDHILLGRFYEAQNKEVE